MPPFGCFSCDRCKYPIIAILENWFTDDIETYWPTTRANKDYPDVPKPIGAAASEAYRCLATGAPRGAVSLARAVVESVAKDKGITKGTLEKKIDALYREDYIGEGMKEAAHEIRFAGNEAAHGDLVVEPLTAEDAQKIVALMDIILERVYQEPAEVARIRQRRETRKAKPLAVEEDSQANGAQRPVEDPWAADPSDSFGGDGAPDEPPF
jgi:hypothetical protein